MGAIFCFWFSLPWTPPSSLSKIFTISYLLLIFAYGSDSNNSASHSLALSYQFFCWIITKILALHRRSIVAPILCVYMN